MAKEVIVKNLNLVGMTDYFNEHYKKKDGGKFSYWNIRAYAVMGKVPPYLGEGLSIVPLCADRKQCKTMETCERNKIKMR